MASSLGGSGPAAVDTRATCRSCLAGVRASTLRHFKSDDLLSMFDVQQRV